MPDTRMQVKHEELRRFCAGLLRAAGASAADAELTATIQVEADLRGVYSHGSRAIPRYVRSLQRGSVNAKPQISVSKEQPAYALLDGDHGLGQVVAARGMELAIRKARAGGFAAVGVQRSTHFGAAAYYSVMAAEAGMIGFTTSSGYGANHAAFGGVTPVLGNHPLSYAIPAGEERTIVLDMATGGSAHGKIALAKMAGKLLPAGFFMTREGEETRDPELARIALPFGGAKGYGLALTMDILSGVMLGDVATVHRQRPEPDTPWGSGHLFLAFNIEAFRPLEEFKAEVDRQIRTIHASETRPGFDRVYLPGELEWLKKEEQVASGVSLPVEDLAALKTLGEELGVKAGWES